MIRSLLAAQKTKLYAVRQFLLLQGVTVAGNLLYGLLCVRLLSTADYAQFVVLFAVQGTFVILMDVGISGSLVPLVGEQTGNLTLIADYLASLRQLSQRLYALLALGLVAIFPLLVRHRAWGARTVVAMVCVLLVSTWCVRAGAAYGAVLVLLRQRGVWYLGQMVASLGTLAALLLLHALHTLGASTAILTSVAGIALTAAFYFRAARRLLGQPGLVSREKQRAILRLALPNVPGVVFYALQGQVALLLLTVFGRTAGIAGLGALSRLGQIFVLFSQMNVLLVEPYFARLSVARLTRSYAGALLATGLLCAAMVAWVCLLPNWFLLVLGPAYSGLTAEVKLVVASSAISYLTSVLWTIHSARRFVYWWSGVANIVLTMLVQALFIWRANLESIRAAVLLNLSIAAVALLTNALTGLYGLARGPRRVDDRDSTATRPAEWALVEGKA